MRQKCHTLFIISNLLIPTSTHIHTHTHTHTNTHTNIYIYTAITCKVQCAKMESLQCNLLVTDVWVLVVSLKNEMGGTRGCDVVYNCVEGSSTKATPRQC